MGNKLCAPLLKKNYNESDYPWHVRKDSHLLRLWAEVFRVHGDGEFMRWQRVSDDVVPVNISCVEDNPRTVFHITAYNRHVEKIFDVRIIQPDTIICPATESFVHWRDSANNCEWGLNFTSPIDARRFRECCSYPTQKFARKATSASSLRLSPPKRVHGKASSVSSPSSPVNAGRKTKCETVCHVSLDSSQTNIPQKTFQLADSQIVTIRKEKSATIPRAQIEQGPQSFKPQGILKAPSDISAYDSLSSNTVVRNTSGDSQNLALRKSMPPSLNSHASCELVENPDNRQKTAGASRQTTGTNKYIGSSNRVSFSSFGKESELVEIQNTQSPHLSDKIQLETAFVGEISKPQKRVTLQEPISGKLKKQVLRVLVPSSQKTPLNPTRKSSSSSSPEWPSPPEPLTPLTPVAPVCNMDFDSDVLKKMLQSLPLSPTEKETKNDGDQGFHDDPCLSEFQTSSKSNKANHKGRSKSMIAHDKFAKQDQSKSVIAHNKVAKQVVEQRKSTGSATAGKCEAKAMNQNIESELYLHNKGVCENYCRDSYPDSGIGGMTIDTTDSVWSTESGKSAPVIKATETSKLKTCPGSMGSSHSSHSTTDSPDNDLTPQMVDCSDSRQYLSAEISDEDGEASDGSLHTMTETDSQIYTQQYGAIRKAGWLVVKNWLVHKKKKLELASKRNWKRYWVCLKGSLLLFNDHNEEQQESSPRHILVLEGGIAQAVPEHPKRDNIFSLSTALGDGYLLQAQSQTDVESWILSIHSACATSHARQHGKDNTLKFLCTELQKLEANIDMDVKMKKMAELQLTVVRDPRSRQAISKQICQWEENLEKLHIEQYRLRCYLASLQGTELPNPKVLLANASKTTKTTLGRLGIFTVTSFHALVCARKPMIVRLINGNTGHKPGIISPKKYNHKTKSPSSPVTEEVSNVVDQVKELYQEAAKCAVKTTGSNSSSPAGSLSRIGLPSNQKTLVGVDKKTTVQQLLDSVCTRRQLNTDDHYVRVKLPDTPPGVYAVPDRNLIIKQIPYEAIDVCQKSIFQLELVKSKQDKDYGMTLEAELGDDLEREDDLKIYISDVRKDGLADRIGLIIGDEILVINRKIVNELDMASIEVLIQQTQTLLLTVRSLRQRRPPSSFITDHTDKPNEGMTCPPPPSQSHLSEQQLGQLIVPNEAANLEKSHKLLTSPKHGLLQKKLNDVEVEELIKSADQVTAISRGTKDVNTKMTSECSSVCTASLSDAQKLRKVVMELIDTERAYVKDLTCLTDRYLEPLKEETFLTSDEIEQLFGNIQEIVQFQRQFLLSLEEGIQLESEFFTTEDPALFKRVLFSLGGSFLYYANHFKVYSSFCASHSRSQKILNPESSNVPHTNESLKKFLLARNPKQQHSATLESYLIKPIQRILKYPLLLNQLCNLTNPDTDENYHLSEALKGMEAVAEHINEMQKIYEEYGSVFDELSKMYKDFYMHKKPVDLSVGDLQMYGTVEWCNMCDVLGKIKKGTELENIVFVFKTGAVFLCRERIKRKKIKGSGSKLSSQEMQETIERFRTLIPVQDVQVRGGRVSDMDGHYWWELIHSRSDKEGRPERLYQFCNSTLDSKSDFMRIIRQTIRDSVRRMTLPPGTQTSKPKYVMHGGQQLEYLSTKYGSKNDVERHSMDFSEKLDDLECDPIFRIRSQTVGDLNEASIYGDEAVLLQVEADSPSSSYSNLSLASQLTCTQPNTGNGVCSPVWKPRNQTPPQTKDTEC